MIRHKSEADVVGRTCPNIRSWLPGATLLSALLLVAVACEGGTIGPTETRDDTFTVNAPPRLEVDTFNGRIVVNATSEGTVHVRATTYDSPRVDYEAVQVGASIRVKATRRGARRIPIGRRSPGADIEITTPVGTFVELKSSNGSLEVYGTLQSGTLETSNGKAIVQDMRGELIILTSNGSIAVEGMVGAVTLETSNGNIDFTGELTPGGSNRMNTSNGSVNVKLEGEPSVKLDASTSNGTISSRLPILTTSTGDKNHVLGTIGEGEAELDIRTSNGSVTIE